MKPWTPGRDVVIAGGGARTAIGLTSAATMAAARAGIAGFNEHPYLVDAAGKKFIVARVPAVEASVPGIERLTALATAAAAEATQPLRERRIKLPTLAVVVGLPPVRPGRTSDTQKAITERLRIELRDVATIVTVDTFATGHAAGSMAIVEGWKKVRSGAADFCLVGGVDSYLDAQTMSWLEKQDQIHGAGPLNNAWGFVPGEAGAFCMLASRDAASKWQLPYALRILNAATTREANCIKTDTVCRGDGLIALFRELAAALPPNRRFEQVLCDMNGEPYRSEEYGFATIRTGASFTDASDFLAPADCWGDVGAASGPLYALWVDAAIRKGYSRGDLTLIWTSAEGGERSGAVIQAMK
jgi:3-oxoacyl-[acyl-carrier-protein] synthase-1